MWTTASWTRARRSRCRLLKPHRSAKRKGRVFPRPFSLASRTAVTAAPETGQQPSRSAFAQHFSERLRRKGRGLCKPADETDRVRQYCEQREVGKGEQLRAPGEPGQVGGFCLCVAFGGVGVLHCPALYRDTGQRLRRNLGRRRRDDQETHVRAQQHVFCMRRELTDMNDEARAVGKHGEGHHRYVRPALVKGSKRSHVLCPQQLAERLGVGGVHRWVVGIIGTRFAEELDATTARIFVRLLSLYWPKTATGVILQASRISITRAALRRSGGY